MNHELHTTVLLLLETTSGTRGIATTHRNTSVKVSNQSIIYRAYSMLTLLLACNNLSPDLNRPNSTAGLSKVFTTCGLDLDVCKICGFLLQKKHLHGYKT